MYKTWSSNRSAISNWRIVAQGKDRRKIYAQHAVELSWVEWAYVQAIRAVVVKNATDTFIFEQQNITHLKNYTQTHTHRHRNSGGYGYLLYAEDVFCVLFWCRFDDFNFFSLRETWTWSDLWFLRLVCVCPVPCTLYVCKCVYLSECVYRNVLLFLVKFGFFILCGCLFVSDFAPCLRVPCTCTYIHFLFCFCFLCVGKNDRHIICNII